MNKKNIITKIKDMFKEEKFMNIKLMDGSAAHIVTAVEGQINTGDTFYLLDENGERKDTPAGDYELEDGFIVSVDEAGFINEIKESAPEDAEGDAPEAVEEPAVEEMSSELFMDITLKDGPLVHIITAKEGSVDAGDKMMIDGVEAAPGEYNTNDNRTIVVGENGVIASVAPVVVEDTVGVVDETTEVVAEESAIELLVGKVGELVEKIGELETSFASMKEENETLKAQVEKFSGAPSAVPTKKNVDFKKANREEKLKFFAK